LGNLLRAGILYPHAQSQCLSGQRLCRTEARAEAEASGKPARRLRDCTWSKLQSWSRAPRVVGKAEWTGPEANPRLYQVRLVRTHEPRVAARVT